MAELSMLKSSWVPLEGLCMLAIVHSGTCSPSIIGLPKHIIDEYKTLPMANGLPVVSLEPPGQDFKFTSLSPAANRS